MTSSANSYKKSSFGPAFFFLSKKQRRALAVYYEFCRLMDDIADEPRPTDPQQELDFWQEEITRVFEHKAQTDLGKSLQEAVKDFALTPDCFLLLVEGMRADLQHKTYETLEALDWYLYRVAGVVGIATLAILGVQGPQANELAQTLGRAVQLTNIIRDVPADAQLERVYLPGELLAQEGLARQDVLMGRFLPKQARVLSRLDQEARRLYTLAFTQMRAWPRLKMLPCRVIACVYAKNLAKIRKRGFLFSSPIKLTKTEKIKGVLHALFQTVFA